MTADDFAKGLNEISPKREDYIAFGFSEGMTELLLKESKIELHSSKRPTRRDLSIPILDNEIINLINNYYVNKLKIGLITFLKQLNSNEDFFFFGNVELDILAINKITLEVVALDHDNPDWVIWPCAANDACFFDAIFAFSQFLSERIKKQGKQQPSQAILEAAVLCAEKAGGEKYLAFYKMILGYDE